MAAPLLNVASAAATSAAVTVLWSTNPDNQIAILLTINALAALLPVILRPHPIISLLVIASWTTAFVIMIVNDIAPPEMTAVILAGHAVVTSMFSLKAKPSVQ